MSEAVNQREALNWQELLDTALTMPGSMGNVYTRFASYSFMNQVLLMSQGVTEPIATYKRWQDLGRQVKKGAKAKAIVRPIQVKVKEAEADEKERFAVRFKVVRCIFQLRDTEGDDLPLVELPGYDLEQAHEVLGVRQVPFEGLDGNVQGWSVGREYAINPLAVNPEKTRLHEWGHIVLGHTAEEGIAEYRQHRGVMEFEAEGTAHLVGNELGLLDEASASSSRAYMQHWLGIQRPPDASIRRVFKATDEILKAGRPVKAEVTE